jgi:P27 family predicted phage terminase small subunit
MGRRPDPPQVQAAKGNPGRRKSAVAKRQEEIERVAGLLGAAPADPTDPNAPPALIDRGKEFAAAIAVWKLLAPRLSSTHRLQPQHRPLFAMFCVYFAEWVTANEDIAKNGLTQDVPTVAAGGSMNRIRPMVKIRDAAFDQVLKLSARFGLTPTDEYDLFRQQQGAAFLNPGLFGRDPEAKPESTEQPAPRSGLVGSLKAMDSAPPSRSVN